MRAVALGAIAVLVPFAGIAACDDARAPVAPVSTATAVHESKDPPPARPVGVIDNTVGANDADGGAEGGADGGRVPIADADRVIASLRPQYKACYQTALVADRNAAGKALFSLKVHADGTVDQVDVASQTGMSKELLTCLSGILRNARFSGPGGAGSTVNVPITLKQGDVAP